MSSQEEPAIPVALREARDIVAEQLERLRALAERERQEAHALNAALRQAERELDEVTLQYRTALQRRRSNAEALGQQMAKLRARCDELTRNVDMRRSGLRQIELLIRQIEMSSSALTNTGTSATSDPMGAGAAFAGHSWARRGTGAPGARGSRRTSAGVCEFADVARNLLHAGATANR